MNEMKKRTVEGLETARKEFNGWSGRSVIFVDFSDYTAWCGVQEIPSYHNEMIVVLVSKSDLHNRNDRFGAERLNKLAKAKIKSSKLVGIVTSCRIHTILQNICNNKNTFY